MDKEAFAEATRGITASRIAEIVGRSVPSVQSYLSGRVPVPDDVAIIVEKLASEIGRLKAPKGKTMRTMKKVIDGKLYDTQTATMIASYANGGSWRDFQHYEEELYRTKRGTFFLAGEGGPMTEYSRRVDQNSCTGGEKIIPLTEKEARKWLEEHSDAETYIAVFGKPEEA